MTIKDHRFTPAEIKVPANKRVTITVINEDATPEEFESNPMKVEKVIAGKSQGRRCASARSSLAAIPSSASINEATAKGAVIAE